jgi:polyhydroxyalkanoate synthesis regulator phasin
MSNTIAGGLKVKDIPKGKNKGLHSKLILAVRSGKRKHKKAIESAKKNGFENSKIENYYGHSSSFDAMVNDIKDKQVIGPGGQEISQEEAAQLIRSGGGGDNPSDTATLVFDKDSNKVIMLFHSDKDSTEALVAQSSIKAEAESNEKNIDKLVQNGSLTKEQGDKVKKDQQELIQNNDEVESKLKKVVNEPGKWFQKNANTSEVLDNIKNDTGPNGEKDKNLTSTKFGAQPPKNNTGAVLDKNGKPRKYLNKYLEAKGIDPNTATEEQALESFLEYMGDDNKEVDPSDDAVTLMERINTRYLDKGAPDIFTKLEDIRNESLQLQRDFITEQDKVKVKIDSKEVGMGTLLEANTVWKQFHLEAVNPNSEVGVHKYPGMFETNHGGLSVDGDTLTKCMGGDVKNQNDFVTRFEVGPLEEQKGVSGTQKGRTTGGKRIVYAITSGGDKIEVGQKVMRTKTGKTGKLQTVYNWSKDMKNCFEKDGKR